MNDVTNLRDTITPKSDQLNADELIATSLTITVTGVSRGNPENPVVINYQNDNGRPYKPCKTMRKLIVAAWGENGNEWINKGMVLYNDPTVKYAGKEVGGIRISHLSHIAKAMQVNLTSTRGRKTLYKIGILN
jgi:hypothetical protein|tara:strand:- start:728 stop:1126 length:399 start_codon:yes stop_codon:yes gene_type:complete